MTPRLIEDDASLLRYPVGEVLDVSTQPLPFLDLTANAPTVLQLAALSGPVPAVAVDPWDYTVWVAAIPTQTMPRELLVGLSHLAQAWRPLHEQGLDPVEGLVERARQLWDEHSYEADYFGKALVLARNMDRATFATQEQALLKCELKGTTDAAAGAFYRLLLQSLRDVERVRKHEDALIQSGENDAEFTRWVLGNLERFLHAHWALTHVHEEVVRLIKKRRRAFAKCAGSVEMPGVSSDEHDDLA